MTQIPVPPGGSAQALALHHPATPALCTDELVRQVAQALLRRGWRLTTAESCTGGLIASCCTDVAGSSQWFDRGFVTYSNAAKCEMLGVDPALIATHGAVSQAVVQAMALGALKHSQGQGQVSVAVTGVAGPSGGSADKPVGTVWLAWAWVGERATHSATNATTPIHVKTECIHFSGDRAAVRAATVAHALRGLLAVLA